MRERIQHFPVLTWEYNDMKGKTIQCLKHGLAESYLKDTILLRYACKSCWEDTNHPLDYLSESDDYAQDNENHWHYRYTFFNNED